ncbi:cytochrome P450 [Aspergillus ambiguus]|uniref:cytochrome P450 n=1 Tax=Aspergillus ambiguus TaxID=176160 RepID=UPI003CCE032A
MGAVPLQVLWPVLLGFALFIYGVLSHSKKAHSDIPIVKHSIFLPDWLNRRIFFLNAPAQIQHGYNKYNDVPFRVLRPDKDLLVLPARYLKEIRQIPSCRLNLIEAEYNNVLGDYTNILKNSELAGTTVLRKLNPAIGRILPRTMLELNYAFDVEIPPCTDNWVSIKLYDVILRLISRVVSSVVFSDIKTSRNEKWVDILRNYSHNLGPTIFFLRPTPEILRPLVARLIPSVQRLRRQLHWVQEELVIPTIAVRRAAEASDPMYQKPDDFLQWMMDVAANDIDRNPRNIAQSMLVVASVGMMHTSTMLTTHALYDILTHPEYLEPLREEIKQTHLDGWTNSTTMAFANQSKLDSLLRETLRFNPPAEVSTQRIAKEPFTFSDGLTISDDLQICFPSGPMARDSTIIPDAHIYDAFRWCREPSMTTAKLVSINETNLHFGYGRLACPGRFFSSGTIKAVISRFLGEYDMRFEKEDQGRPSNLRLGEQIMPSMWTKVLIRKRVVKN